VETAEPLTQTNSLPQCWLFLPPMQTNNLSPPFRSIYNSGTFSTTHSVYHNFTVNLWVCNQYQSRTLEQVQQWGKEEIDSIVSLHTLLLTLEQYLSITISQRFFCVNQIWFTSALRHPATLIRSDCTPSIGKHQQLLGKYLGRRLTLSFCCTHSC